MAKTQYQDRITGRGTLRYPKITQPDTKGEYADGRYKTDFIPDDLEAEKKIARDFAIKVLGEKRGKVCRIPFAEKDGVEFLRAKSSKNSPKQPEIFDVKGNPVKTVPNIGGGTVARLKISYGTYPKDVPKDVTAYLNGVQIIKLESFGSRGEGFEDASDLADDDEGYEASDEGFADESEADVEEEKPVAKKTSGKAKATDF